MKIDIYCSQNNSTKFLSVPTGTKLSDMKFPAKLDPDLRKLAPFKSGYDIGGTKSRTALDPAEIIAQIKKHGYAAHRAGIKMTEKT